MFRIRRDTFDHKGNRLFKEVVHGVTSLTAAQASPDVIARFIRQPWGIEGKIHWVRDVAYRDDHQHATADPALTPWPSCATSHSDYY
jgi:predicted transposase YbfD/YdcC